jgi:hypothetical protein
MDDERLREMFRRAAEIASVVPESMHEAAFNRALDALTSTGQPNLHDAARSHPKPRIANAPAEPKSSDPVVDLSAMERSRAAEVDSAKGGMAKALALLFVARREMGIDGLTASQIASVLTDKFRWRVTRQAVGQAMDAAGNRVDRVKQKGATVFRIMEAGERWLATPQDEVGVAVSGGTQPRSTARRRRKPKTPGKNGPTNGTNPVEAEPATRPVARKSSRGPKAAVETLIDAGWFANPRGLSAIRVEVENRLALHYKATDLGPTMTRLLREGRLRRSKTESGQYEYQS